MKVIDDDDASLLPKIGADGFPLQGTVTRARDYNPPATQRRNHAPDWRARDRIRLLTLIRPVLKRRGFPYRSTDNPLQV